MRIVGQLEHPTEPSRGTRKAQSLWSCQGESSFLFTTNVLGNLKTPLGEPSQPMSITHSRLDGLKKTCRNGALYRAHFLANASQKVVGKHSLWPLTSFFLLQYKCYNFRQKIKTNADGICLLLWHCAQQKCLWVTFPSAPHNCRARDVFVCDKTIVLVLQYSLTRSVMVPKQFRRDKGFRKINRRH